MAMKVSRRLMLRSVLLGGAGSGVMSQLANAKEAAGPSVVPANQPQGACVLFPEAVEGPYYFDPAQVRSDITEKRSGFPVRLVLKVVEHASCTPIEGARVDVWHADARGVYSGYANQGDNRDVSAEGKTYLRGTQISDEKGEVKFETIYPGWYPGRTPHIHVKVFLDRKTLVTSQAYFPDALSARVYREYEPYVERPVADTTNATDYFFKRGQSEGGGIVLAVEEGGETLTASLTMSVDRSGGRSNRASNWRSFWR